MTSRQPVALPGDAARAAAHLALRQRQGTRDGPVEQRRFGDLEAYRGIAALLIVVFHTYQHSREGTHLPTYLYEGTPLQVVTLLAMGDV